MGCNILKFTTEIPYFHVAFSHRVLTLTTLFAPQHKAVGYIRESISILQRVKMRFNSQREWQG